jgi:tRNA(adenine34) deaminase
MKKTDEFFMDKALAQARVAFGCNEVPVGVVIVDAHDTIIARAYNKIEAHGCQNAHAEMLAIQSACKKIGDWRLNGCRIYVTLEPCLMCMGLITLSRIKAVVFGATSDLFGSGLSNIDTLPLYAKNLKIEGGIKKEECIILLQAFFKKARQKEKGKK